VKSSGGLSKNERLASVSQLPHVVRAKAEHGPHVNARRRKWKCQIADHSLVFGDGVVQGRVPYQRQDLGRQLLRGCHYVHQQACFVAPDGGDRFQFAHAAVAPIDTKLQGVLVLRLGKDLANFTGHDRPQSGQKGVHLPQQQRISHPGNHDRTIARQRGAFDAHGVLGRRRESAAGYANCAVADRLVLRVARVQNASRLSQRVGVGIFV